jgi:hypothetical protein
MHVIRVLAAAALVALTGCATPVPRVVRGEVLATGHTTYDDFFVAVREIRSEAAAAADDEEASHAPLLKALGLEPKSRPALAVDESGVRAKKLQERGLLLHLEIAPEARLLEAKLKPDPGLENEPILKAVEEAAKASLEMRKRFAAVAARVVELEKRRVDLRAQAQADFRAEPQAKREEVIAELDAAQGVLADALTKANASAGAAARFVVELAQAVETGAIDPPPKGAKGAAAKRPVIIAAVPPAPPAIAAAPPAAAAPAAAAPKPAPAAAPAAAPKPAPKPAAPAAPPAKKKPKGGGDDFEP